MVGHEGILPSEIMSAGVRSPADPLVKMRVRTAERAEVEIDAEFHLCTLRRPMMGSARPLGRPTGQSQHSPQSVCVCCLAGIALPWVRLRLGEWVVVLVVLAVAGSL